MATLPDDLIQKKPRKGTKSCTECRRRKVRCTWSSDDAKVCRRCEERGANCQAQTFFASASDLRRLTSRQRIQQLEAKVAGLHRSIRAIEARLGSQQFETPNSATTATQADSVLDDYDDASSSSGFSDVLGEDRPTHLRSLFHNEWLSADTGHEDDRLHDHKARSTARLLDIARHSLQELIPSKEVLDAILSHSYASRWLELMHALFPQPYVVRSQRDFIETYNAIREPNADSIMIASWLLSLGLTALQVPQSDGSPGAVFNGTAEGIAFANTIADTVERTILSQNTLINSVDGLGLAMLCGRLQVFQGNFQRGWLQLRRAIAVAELMGLPQTLQLVTMEASTSQMDRKDPRMVKADLWESMLALDRICSTMLNLPSGTRIYVHSNSRSVVVDGEVQPRVYLAKLADIAIKTQYVDDINASTSSRPELYNTVLQLDKEIRILVAAVPVSWWQEPIPDQLIEPHHVLQQWHYYVTLRVHLPFMLVPDPGPLYSLSRLAGLGACRSIINRYLVLRKSSPSAFFLGRFLDLQAFISCVVLLLTSVSKNNIIDNVEASELDAVEDVKNLVAQVVALMDEKSRNIIGPANFGRHGVNTIRALQKLLRQEPGSERSTERMTLKVPLLGKLHVRRAGDTANAKSDSQTGSTPYPIEMPHSQSRLHPTTNAPLPSEVLQSQSSWLSGGIAGPGGAPMQPMGMSLDPLSWSVDNNYEDFFQDAMMEGFENWSVPMV